VPARGAGRARESWQVTVTPDPPHSTSGHSTPWRALKYAAGLLAIGTALWAISGKTGELEGASGYLTHLRWWWVAIAVAAEAASYLAMSSAQKRLLAAGGAEVSMVPMTGISLGGSAIQYSLPGGSVFYAAYTFRQYRRQGADELVAGWTLLAFNAVAFVALALLAALGLALALSAGNTYDLVGAILGIVASAGLLVLAWTERARLARPVTKMVAWSQRVVRHPDPAVAPREVVGRWARLLGGANPSRSDWLHVSAMGLSLWAADLVCLAVSFLAVRSEVPWRGLLLAYGAGQLAAILPFTPGGLGVVEGSITVALVTFGGAEASTVAAVLVYRLISFWLVLVVGWLAVSALALTSRRAEAVAALADRPSPGSLRP